MAIFTDFASISNLKLNMQKTVVIPLWQSSATSIRRWLQDEMPKWAGVQIAWHARYLGFHIGPGRAELSWDNAVREFHRRVVAWSSLHLGLQANALVYRTFCCSVFGFLWQLDSLPDRVLAEEAWALRRLAPGPGNWIRPVDPAIPQTMVNCPRRERPVDAFHVRLWLGKPARK